MISLKVLSTAAVMALVLPMVCRPKVSPRAGPQGAGAHPGGGRPGGGVRPGGGPAAFKAARYRRRLPWRLSRRWRRRWRRFGRRRHCRCGGRRRDRIQGGYGYGPGYYAPGPGYYDGGYDDGGPVAVAPGPGGGDDAVAYCMQTYKSYDPQSGTYLGYDGMRHPCP